MNPRQQHQLLRLRCGSEMYCQVAPWMTPAAVDNYINRLAESRGRQEGMPRWLPAGPDAAADMMDGRSGVSELPREALAEEQFAEAGCEVLREAGVPTVQSAARLSASTGGTSITAMKERTLDLLGLDDQDLAAVGRLSEAEANGFVAWRFVNRLREQGLNAAAEALSARLDADGRCNLRVMGAQVREAAARHDLTRSRMSVLAEAGVPIRQEFGEVFGI
jgi:hypothetical protein